MKKDMLNILIGVAAAYAIAIYVKKNGVSWASNNSSNEIIKTVSIGVRG